MQTTQTITLDFHTKSIYTIRAKQTDSGSRFVRVTLTENGAVYHPPEGVTAQFRCLKPDGTSVLDPAAVNADGTVTVELTQQALAVPGTAVADICLIDGAGDVLSTLSFVILVELAPLGKNVASTSEYLALMDALQRAEQAVAEIDTTLAASTEHIANKSNPHAVTKEQVGLGNVPNVATNDQTPTYSQASTLTGLASGEKLSVAFGKIKKAVADLISHLANKSNPHGVTAEQAGARADDWLPTLAELGAAAAIGVGSYTGDLDDYAKLMNTVCWINGSSVSNSPHANYGVVETWGNGSGIVCQRYTGTGQIIAERMRYNNAWTEWMWVNPATVSGTEYLTTEKWGTNRVYTKRLYLGSVTNGTQVSAGLDTTTISSVIRYQGVADGYPLPFVAGAGSGPYDS